jgi:hypothetical protein
MTEIQKTILTLKEIDDALYSSHVLRFSDSSQYDFVCIKCGRHDNTPRRRGITIIIM